jgi:hypothetical protein
VTLSYLKDIDLNSITGEEESVRHYKRDEGKEEVVCILLDISPTSDCDLPTFRNLLSVGSETSANHNLTPGKYPKEYIQCSKHGESLKSRTILILHT